MNINSFEQLQALFIPAEKTAAGISFGDPPKPVTFNKAKVIVFGVPFDDTATFGKGSEHGPQAIRHTSARQIETFVLPANVDAYEKFPVYDLGDLKIQTLTEKEKKILQSAKSKEDRNKVLEKLNQILKQFDVLIDITKFLRAKGKIPLMLGGEHTLSYWSLCAVANENPVVLHFDAHRDAKDEYANMKMCHTTPMRRFLEDSGLNRGKDFIQIGIRQTDFEEQKFAEKVGITTIKTEYIRENSEKVVNFIQEKTKGRNVYVTFDIDALDIAYTRCTGTPEPFGLTPEEVVRIFTSINKSANLIGIDMMEVAVKNEDFSEGTIATQLLLRLLLREYLTN